MPSVKTPSLRSFAKNLPLVVFFVVVFAVIALRSEAPESFSHRGAMATAIAVLFLVFAVNRLKKIPQLVEWLLFLSRPLALVLCFPCSAAVMLAVTLALLKGLVAYFFGLSTIEGAGRQRLLFDLGLLPLSRSNTLRYFDDVWFSLCFVVGAVVAFFVPASAHIVATLLWCVLAGFVAVDLLPYRETFVGDATPHVR